MHHSASKHKLAILGKSIEVAYLIQAVSITSPRWERSDAIDP